MDAIERVRLQTVRGKTIERILEERYSDFECFWFLEKGNIVRFVQNTKFLPDKNTIIGMTIYEWQITGDKVIAYNQAAMRLTPELASIRVTYK